MSLSLSSEPAPARTLSRAKRVSFTVLALLLALLVVDAAAFVGFWLYDGKPLSWAAMQGERAAIVADFAVDGGGPRALKPEVNHPFLGYVLDPDRNPDVSELGFAGPNPLSLERAADTLVVAIVGGSVASNLADKAVERLIEELEAAPALAGREIVTLNLALGGYKQPQQLMTLNYLLALGAEPDVVVNVDGFNEVALHRAENAKKKIFPVYPRNWYGRARQVPDGQARYLIGEIAHVQAKIVRNAETFSAAPLRFSATANLVWRLRHVRLLERHWRAREALRLYEPAEVPYRATGPRIDPGSGAELYDHLAAIWKRSSLQMDRLCRANGIRYFHFLQPNQYVPGSKVLTDEERETFWLEDHPYRPGAEAGYPLLRRAGRELQGHGVAFFDLSELFADVEQTVYADECCHYNALGRGMLATRIGRTIAEQL